MTQSGGNLIGESSTNSKDPADATLAAELSGSPFQSAIEPDATVLPDVTGESWQPGPFTGITDRGRELLDVLNSLFDSLDSSCTQEQ